MSLQCPYDETMDKPAPSASTKSPTLPRLRISSFTSPETLLHNGTSYTLTATLEYVPGSGTEPVTLRCESLTCIDFTSYESWLFHHPNTDLEKVVDHFFPDVCADDDALPVDREHGFITLSPGEKVDRDVVIWTCFWGGLKVGEEYDLSMRDADIGWWEWGRMDDFAGRKVMLTERRADGVTLEVPRSKSIRVKVVDEDTMPLGADS